MTPPRNHDGAIHKLAREARFIFAGSVEVERSSSLSFLPAGPSTAVVRVERILHAPAALHNQSGQQVTVLFHDDLPRSEVGARRVFFTEPILYGETIGVRALDSIEAPDDLEGLQKQVRGAVDEMKEDELRKHLESAETVLLGRVTEVRPASEVPPLQASEHDPDWGVAVVQASRVLKGGKKGGFVVRFPRSRDIHWYRVPKLKEKQEGLFILHRDGLEAGRATLALLHPDDFLETGAEEIPRISELL